MANTINASISPAGIVQTADASGILQLQTAGTTAVTIDASQNVTTSANLTYTGTLTGSTGILNIGSGQVYKDASGNVGIGTSSPATILDVVGSGNPTLTLRGSAGAYTSVLKLQAASGGGSVINATGATSDSLQFQTTGTERARIDSSGNLLVGTTSSTAPNPGFSVYVQGAGNTQAIIGHSTSSGSGQAYVVCAYNGGTIGSITQNGTTGVLYNLTSDYRLKNNPTALTGASEFIMALQPKTWDWWDGSGKGVGFIAHEFMEVAKYSGNGTKDEVDAKGKPVMQSIQPSSSEVMANLVSFAQEQQTLIEALTARLTALEAK